MSRRQDPKNQKRSVLLSPMAVMILLTVAIITIGGFAFQGIAPKVSSSGDNDFALADFSNQTVRLSDYRGQTVMINLWASWCPPCRAEMPDLIAFYNAHQKDGLVFLAIATSDDKSAAQKFMREQNMPFSVLFDPDSIVMRQFGAQGLPSTFVIDRNGVTRFSWTGQISPAMLNSRVAPLLAQPSSN